LYFQNAGRRLAVPTVKEDSHLISLTDHCFIILPGESLAIAFEDIHIKTLKRYQLKEVSSR
jgi:hypothetical protein